MCAKSSNTFHNPFAVLPKERFARTRTSAVYTTAPAPKQAVTPQEDDAATALFLAAVIPKNPQALDEDLSNDFMQAVQGVSPLTGKGRAVATPPTPVPTPWHVDATMQDILDGKLDFALSLSGEYLEGHVVGLDSMTMQKLRAGHFSPEAHLDLHGLNAAQAFYALVNFFRGAWYKGVRAVLIVPGRGRNSADGLGVLRNKLQEWLTRDPLKRVVLAFCTARPADGGPGSVYVLLRKYRKKGKVCWERLPPDPDLY